jgi:hypothetical protein
MTVNSWNTIEYLKKFKGCSRRRKSNYNRRARINVS